MGYIIAIVVLFFLMICESGGVGLALIIYAIGFLALMLWPESEPEPKPAAESNAVASKLQNTDNSAYQIKVSCMGSDYVPSHADCYEDTEWDNSWQAGGLPRDLSPYWDIDDPYEREILEWEDMEEEASWF